MKVQVTDMPAKLGSIVTYRNQLVELQPTFLHFTWKDNLEGIFNSGALGSQVEGSYKAGCTSACSSTYVYNLDLTTKLKVFTTLPNRILSQPDDWVALLFDSSLEYWWYSPEECSSRYIAETDSYQHIPITKASTEILTVEEAFSLVGSSIKQAIFQKTDFFDYNKHYLDLL